MSGPSVKVPADWLDSDQVEQLGADAVLLMLTALGYSARQLSEGDVPKRALRKLWPVGDLEAVTQRLVDAGEVIDKGNSLHFVDWREFLLTADEVDRIKEQNKVRDERRRRHNKGDHSICNPKYCKYAEPRDSSRENHVSPRVSHADPTRTDPTRTEPDVVRGEVRVEDGVPDGAGAPPAAVPKVEKKTPPPPSLPHDLKHLALKIAALIAAEDRYGLTAHEWTSEPQDCCPAPRRNPIHDTDTSQIIAERAGELSEYIAYYRGGEAA